jgi:glucose/arabinose dehydrogenase
MKLQQLLPTAAALLFTANLIAPEARAQDLEATLVTSGYSAPLYLCSPPGDNSRLFILEQSTARIKIYKPATGSTITFMDIGSIVGSGSERGLLGMAFHPDYASNRKFYVSYTNNSGSSMLVQYLRSSGSADSGDTSSATTIYGPVSQPFSNHNGGCIQFGHDGRLYLGFGDGGSANDPGNRAQNMSQTMGKMLRFDVDGPAPYSASDNPFYTGSNGLSDYIWTLGWRNPWRFSFDRQTGDMWIGDVGQNQREEISFEPASSTGGNNYGWRCMEAYRCTGLSGCTCNASSLTDPVHEVTHSGGNCSITGGYRYRGSLMPNMVGRYFFGDYCSGKIWSGQPNGTGPLTNVVDHTSDLAIPGGENITSFGEDANGELYVVDASGGQIWRLEESCPATSSTYCTASVNSGGGGAFISITGTPSVSQNNVTLHVAGAVGNQFGLFYYGSGQINLPFGNGFRCVGAGGIGIFRLGPPAQSDSFGDMSRHWDLTQSPSSSGSGAITAGSTWNIQYWYRDPGSTQGDTFNLSNAVSVSWCQ